MAKLRLLIQKLPTKLDKLFLWRVLKKSIALFKLHDTSTHSGSLSYFTIFSLAPILIIIISLAGLFLGKDAVEGEVKQQLTGLIGPASAGAVQDIVKSAYKPGKSVLFTIIAILMLLLGSTAVFGQLRKTLNKIWDVKPSAKKPVVQFFFTKVFSIAMMATLAFLLLVSLVVQSILGAFTGYLNDSIPNLSVVLYKVFNVVVSTGVTTVLFALIYRYMSDARPKWKMVWQGALFTTIMFTLGKYAIGLYLGQSNFATTYGASGSIIVLIVWVFYSSQILFLGAEFTHALAAERGLVLDSNAMAPKEIEDKPTATKKGNKPPVKKRK